MFAKLGYYICVPFAFLTRLFYSWTGSYGVALILFTLVVKLVLLPFQLKSKKSMLRMSRMQARSRISRPGMPTTRKSSSRRWPTSTPGRV